MKEEIYYNPSNVVVTRYAYDYDLRGNLLKRYKDGMQIDSYTPNVGDEIATRNGVADIAYDANGNMTRNAGWEYVYNSENQI